MLAWFRRLLSDSPTERQAPAVAPAPAAGAMKSRRFASDGGVSALQHSQIDFLFAGWLFETEDHADIFTSPIENTILAALDEVAKSEQSGAHLVQRMPGVIPQLLQSLRSEEFSGAEVAHKISHDLTLVAEVLRLANSAAYSRGQPIASIDHAILMLGQDGLRQLIASVAFKPIINLNSGGFTRRLAPRLWSQSERCALACRMLADDQDVDAIDAFLAGLLQNVGLTISLRVIDRMAQPTQSVGSPTFCNALAAHGRILTCNIVGEWHFPDTVTDAIREQNTDAQEKLQSPLGRILRMADYLSKIDILTHRRRLDARALEVLDGLSDREIACLQELAALEERDWVALTRPNARETSRAG